MKKLILLFGILMCGGVNAQIVNNSGSLASDSISLPFTICDSNCYKTLMLTASDSIFIWVFRPGGAGAVFKDSVLASNTRVVKDSINNTRGAYALRVAVADIDGVGADGVFSYNIVARDVSLGLDNMSKGFFQLYQNSDFNVWATRVQDSLQTTLDSVTAILDSIQNKTNWTILDVTDSVIVDGSALAATADAITSTTIQVAAIGASELAPSAANAIADTVWKADTTGNKTASGFGRVLGAVLDSLNLLDEKYTSLRDSINLVHAEVNLVNGAVFPTTVLGLGDSAQYMNVKNWVGTAIAGVSNVGGQNVVPVDVKGWRAGVPKDLTADSSVRVDIKGISLDTVAANNMELLFDTTGFYMNNSRLEKVDTVDQIIEAIGGGTGLDSATTSRILHRVGWGTSKSAGSDSSTVAERDVTASASGLDSATTSRVLHRVVWGTSITAGSDSSTLAQRDATAADIVAGAITVSEAPNLLALADSAKYMNVKSIAGEANTATATNLHEALDNDNVMAPGLELTDIKLIGVGNDTAFVARGSGDGFGAFFTGGTTAHGIQATAGGSAKDGIHATGQGAGEGISAEGGTSGTGFQAATQVGGSGFGILADGGGTGTAFRLIGGTTSGDALSLAKTSGVFITSAARQELASTIADTTWNSLMSARSGTLGSFGDSALDWGRTGGSGATTAQIADTVKKMMGENPHIASGRQVMYKGTVKTLPGTTGFSVNGASAGEARIDTTKLDDFYNQCEIVFYSGALRGKPITVVDWVAATDSFAIDVNWGVQTPIAPAINDSFMIIGQPAANVWAWSGNVLGEATQLGGSYWPQVDTRSISLDATAADNMESWFDGTGYNGVENRIEYVDTVVTIRDNEVNLLAAEVADSILENILTTGHNRLETVGGALMALGGVQDSVKDSIANSTTAFKSTLTGTSDPRGQTLRFISGGQTGVSRTVVGFSSIPGFITVNPPLASIPTNTDRFVILGDRTSRVGQTGYAAIDVDSAAGDIAAAQIETDAIGALEIAASAVTEIADTVWKSNFVARDGVAGSIIDSAGGWGATGGAGTTDTTAIKTMLYNNPIIASGKQVAYYGRVNDAAPTTTRFIPAGLGGTINAFDLTKADDFYNDMNIRFVSGSQKGISRPIIDWKTTPDSLFVQAFLAAPTNSDSFVVESQMEIAGGWVDSNKTEQGGITGANRTWNVYVFDTSGTDTPIPNADVDVQLTDGTVKLRGTTASSGLVTFTVTDGAWVLVSQETGYVLNNLSKTISANSTDTVKGYDFVVGTPANASLTRCYGNIRSIEDLKLDGAQVIATLNTGKNQADSVGVDVIVTDVIGSTTSDSTGYFFLDLRKTATYSNTSRGYYDFKIYYGGKQIFEIPKVNVTGTTLNLGEILALRQ